MPARLKHVDGHAAVCIFDIWFNNVSFSNALHDVSKQSAHGRQLSDFERSMLEIAFLASVETECSIDAIRESTARIYPTVTETLDALMKLLGDDIWEMAFFKPVFNSCLVQTFFSRKGKYENEIIDRVLFEVSKIDKNEKRFIENFKSSLFKPAVAHILDVPVEAVEPCGSGNLNVVHHFKSAPSILCLQNKSGERNLFLEKTINQRDLEGTYSLSDELYNLIGVVLSDEEGIHSHMVMVSGSDSCEYSYKDKCFSVPLDAMLASIDQHFTVEFAIYERYMTDSFNTDNLNNIITEQTRQIGKRLVDKCTINASIIE